MSVLKTTTNDSTIFFGLSSFQALAMFRRGIFYTFLPLYLRSYLGMSVTETTLFETIPMILNILFQALVWGRLTDKVQLRRSLIIVGELLAGAGHFLMWYLHWITGNPRASGYVIIAGLTVIEIFWSMSNIGWSAYISDVYAEERRNSIQGKFSSVGGVGRIVGAALGGVLYDGMNLMYPGWGFEQGPIFFVSASVMLISVVPLLFIPEGGVGYGSHPDAREKPLQKTGTGGATGGDMRVFILFLVAIFLVNSGINSMAVFRSQFLDLSDGFAASPSTISFVVNIEAATLIVAGLMLGALGRRFGVPALLLSGSVAGILSLVMYVVAPSIGFIYVGSIFKGVSDAFIASSSYAYASLLIPPQKRGRYFALYNSTSFLSWGLSATLITGPLIDALMKIGRSELFAYKGGLLSGVALMVVGLGLLVYLFAGSRVTRRIRKPA
ncbi:MAG: MFS transporter [Spirochaetales bacterium]|nr:MFS transporter [Spirochaetales bacterium]